MWYRKERKQHLPVFLWDIEDIKSYVWTLKTRKEKIEFYESLLSDTDLLRWNENNMDEIKINCNDIRDEIFYSFILERAKKNYDYFKKEPYVRTYKTLRNIKKFIKIILAFVVAGIYFVIPLRIGTLVGGYLYKNYDIIWPIAFVSAIITVIIGYFIFYHIIYFIFKWISKLIKCPHGIRGGEPIKKLSRKESLGNCRLCNEERERKRWAI